MNINVAKISLKTFLFLTLVGIFITFYLRQEATAFIKKRETFSNRGEKVEFLSIPGILFCPLPGFKPSIAKKFGIPGDDPSFLWKDVKENYLEYNLSIWQAYNELSFNVDQDYELTFAYSTTFGEETYTSELKPTSQKEIAIYSHGMCVLTTFSDIVKPNIQWKKVS